MNEWLPGGMLKPENRIHVTLQGTVSNPKISYREIAEEVNVRYSPRAFTDIMFFLTVLCSICYFENEAKPKILPSFVTGLLSKDVICIRKQVSLVDVSFLK